MQPIIDKNNTDSIESMGEKKKTPIRLRICTGLRYRIYPKYSHMQAWANSVCVYSVWPRGYETFFLPLNSVKHEVFSATKYENANNSWHFHIY